MKKSAPAEIPQAAADIFASLDTLRVTPDGSEGAIVQSVLNFVPVRKPSKDWFFRIHPEYSLEVLILELKDDGEVLLVDPKLQGALLEEKCVSLRTIRLGVNRQGNIFLWPVRKPVEGKRDAWATSALDAICLAETDWTRMQADMNYGAYKIQKALVTEVPKWPEQQFNELLRIGFKGAIVDDLDHPTLRRLRGEV
jgi:hypothetical protein